MRADRTICSRCRSRLVPVARAVPDSPRVNKPTVLMAAAVLGVATMIGGSIWMRNGSDPQPSAPTARRPDPLAARRATTGTPDTPAAQTDRKPVDPQGEGTMAYGDGNYAIALERYQAAVAKNPDDAESLSNLGQVLVRLGKVEEAIPYFDRAIGLIPQRWAYRFNRARALGILGRTEEAVAGYRDAQQLFPNDYATAFNLGLALHRMGDEAGAVEAYKKAIELDPNDATFRLALGTSLERLQRPRDAASAYDEYLRLAPAAPDAEKVRARITQLTQPSPPTTPGQPGS
jgi:tetratricopeptide (TPR) repeat protein